MHFFHYPSFTFFRLFLFLCAALSFLSAPFALAKDNSPTASTGPTLSEKPSDASDAEDDNEIYKGLPDIEAKNYSVKVIRRSSSNKIYLFEDSSDAKPTPGRILLLKREAEPIMAFRILRNYPEKRQFAGKRIKRYRNHRFLENDEIFLGIEKVSDLVPTFTSQDQADLKELERQEHIKVEPFDPELDTSTSQKNDEENDDEEDDSHLALAIEEPTRIDHYRHWLTAGFGWIKNAAPAGTGGYYYFSAGNLRYGYTMGNVIFFDKPNLQDSLTLEFGGYLYKAINFATQGDAYTIATVVAGLRYNLMFSESFGLFFYGGLTSGYVLLASQGQDASVVALRSLLPAAGAGFLFQVGPNWYTRFDIGIESVGLNLVLKF